MFYTMTTYVSDDIYNIPISLSSLILFFSFAFSMHCCIIDTVSYFVPNFMTLAVFVWNDSIAHDRLRDMELTSELDNSQLQDQLRRLMVNIFFYILDYNLYDKIQSFKKVLKWLLNKKNSSRWKKIGISSRF